MTDDNRAPRPAFLRPSAAAMSSATAIVSTPASLQPSPEGHSLAIDVGNVVATVDRAAAVVRNLAPAVRPSRLSRTGGVAQQSRKGNRIDGASGCSVVSPGWSPNPLGVTISVCMPQPTTGSVIGSPPALKEPSKQEPMPSWYAGLVLVLKSHVTTASEGCEQFAMIPRPRVGGPE
jgi:hypothetical protein